MTDNNENLNEFFDDGKVKCEVCGERFRFISPQHLKKHNMDTNEYKRLYPEAELAGSSFMAKKKFKNTGLFEDDNKKDNEKENTIEDIENELPTPDRDDDELIDSEDLDDELYVDMFEFDDDGNIYGLQDYITDEINIDKMKQEFNEKFKDIKLDHKLNVAKYLYSKLPNITHNFFVKFYDQNGFVTNRYITDFGDPVNKLVFFFPDVYWHNEEMPPIENKYRMLKEYGWKVIEIKGKDIVHSLRSMLE